MTEIVDAHHHIWRQADLPWLSGPMQPRIFGPYEPIRRDYPIQEYLDDLAGSGVTRSVYVQTNWANDRFEDEAAWVQETAKDHGWPHAIVSYADFNVDDVRPQLDRLARYPLVRGVRMQLHWHENPLYRFAARPDLCADPKIRRNVAPARRLWLQLRPAGVRAADGRCRRARRGLSGRDLRPAARRHAGRPFARRAAPPGAVA